MPGPELLVLPEVVRPLASGLGVKQCRKHLRNVGVEAGFGGAFRRLLWTLPLAGDGVLGDGGFDTGSGIIGAQGLAGDGGAGAVIDEDLVVGVAAVAGGVDDLDAVCLEPGHKGAKGRRSLIERGVNALADGPQVIEMVWMWMVELLGELAQGGLARQLRGHDGWADTVALIIKGEVIKSIMLPGLAARTAGLGGHVVCAEDGVVFIEVGEVVVAADAAGDVVDGFREGLGGAGNDLLDLVRGGDIGTASPSGWGQIKLLFDGFSGWFRKAIGQKMGLNPTSIGPDQGGDDMDVGVPGVLVPVHEIGVVAHFQTFHIAVGDGGKLVIGELVGRRKVQRGVQHFLLGASVEFIEPLEPLQFVDVGEAVFFLDEIPGVDELGAALCHFFLIVSERFGGAVDRFYSRDHCLIA